MQDRWGVTPLIAACWNNHINTARILVENGAIVDLLSKVILWKDIIRAGAYVHVLYSIIIIIHRIDYPYNYNKLLKCIHVEIIG